MKKFTIINDLGYRDFGLYSDGKYLQMIDDNLLIRLIGRDKFDKLVDNCRKNDDKADFSISIEIECEV